MGLVKTRSNALFNRFIENFEFTSRLSVENINNNSGDDDGFCEKDTIYTHRNHKHKAGQDFSVTHSAISAGKIFGQFIYTIKLLQYCKTLT